MKHVVTASALALALVAGAASAIAAETSSMQSAKTPSYAAPVIADADAMKGMDEVHHTNLRQQLQSQLEKAGYTQVKITPSSFFVEAKDKKGEPVAMVIGPDSFTEVTQVAVKTPGPTAQKSPDANVKQK